jgi:hypothetical protein
MKVSCDSIEYIPFSIDVECHYEATYSVNVIKFKNLKFDNGGEITFVKGKSYPFLIGHYNQFHAIPDLCGQFEALNSFDKDIIPFFISEGKRSILSYKEFSIQEFIPYVYLNYYNINQSECIDLVTSSIVFEEAYMIIDFHKLIPKEVYSTLGCEVPEWYKDGQEIVWDANSAFLKIRPLVEEAEIEKFSTQILSLYSHNYDYFIRDGIEKFKEKVLPFLNKKDSKSKGVYISRTKTTKKYINEHKKAKSFIAIQNTKYTLTNRCYKQEVFFENYFKENGYQIVYLEDLKYIEQLEVLLNTKTVVALHGSGLVNTFICDKETNIYEIMLPVPEDNWWQNFFFLFSPISGCIDKKNSYLSCIQDRRWKQVYGEENAMNINEWLKD